MKRLIMAFLALICVACSVYGEVTENVIETPITITPLNDHLYIITCMGGPEFNQPQFGTNLIASVGPDGILLVDAGFNSTGQALRDTLKTLGNGNIKTVINTHHHLDHTGGNKYLKDEATFIAHRYLVERMSGDYFHLEGTPDPDQPHVGINDSLIISFNGEEIHGVYTPNCHTQGDVYVYFIDSKVIATGDLFFSDEIPYIDLRNGGTVEGYTNQIKAFMEDFPDDVIFITSHGRQYNKGDMKAYHKMLTETTALITSAAENGKTHEDMVEENILADWQKWEGQFQITTLAAWIQTVYTEITGGWESRISICAPLTEILVKGVVQDAVQEYHQLKSTQSEKYTFDEFQLNMLGYQLLMRDRIDDAAEIFKLNMEEYPTSSNVYDSYGEILLTTGDTTQSVDYYKKSLVLNPDNTNAVEVLKGLGKYE